MMSRALGRRLAIAGFWILFGAVSGLQIQLSMLSHHHSWLRVISYQVLVWMMWIGFTYAIVGIVRRVPITVRRPVTLVVHASMAAGIGLLHTAYWVALQVLLMPYDAMSSTNFRHSFGVVLQLQLPFEVVLYALVVLADHVERTSLRERERERHAAQLETSLAQARLLGLELQTQPHFLFNTLNGIGALVRTGQNSEALAMIGGLSDLLRYALDRTGGPLVTLEEEMGAVRRYLGIQQIRFADRLTVEVRIEPGVERAEIPPLLLQPLVENAIQHGISRRDAAGRIALRARRDGESLTIEIFNTGTLGPERPEGIGLSGARARLAQLFGARAGVRLAAADDGVLACVTLPWSVKP